MILIFRNKADEQNLQKVAEELKGYIKVAVDVNKKILAAGGARHVDCEQLLLKEGSRQEDVWGAGLDLETNEVDYDSMINLRPGQGNMSREVLDAKLRIKIEEAIRNLLR